ncbi:hypothetical protein ACFQX6_46830 [Streptosporangium lutulentum]
MTITAVVDPVAALASENLDENIYFYDTNRAAGSTGFGTPSCTAGYARATPCCGT